MSNSGEDIKRILFGEEEVEASQKLQDKLFQMIMGKADEDVEKMFGKKEEQNEK